MSSAIFAVFRVGLTLIMLDWGLAFDPTFSGTRKFGQKNVVVSLFLCTLHVASVATPTHVLLTADANSVSRRKGAQRVCMHPLQLPRFLHPHCMKYMVCIHAFILQVGDSISTGSVR